MQDQTTATLIRDEPRPPAASVSGFFQGGIARGKRPTHRLRKSPGNEIAANPISGTLLDRVTSHRVRKFYSFKQGDWFLRIFLLTLLIPDMILFKIY